MDHGLNGHCLKKGLCPGDRRPPTRYISRLWASLTIQEDTRNRKYQQTYPVDCRATSPTTQERDSLKSRRSWLAKRAHLETWDLSRKCEGCRKPADFQKRINGLGADLSRLNIGNTLTLGTGAWPSQKSSCRAACDTPAVRRTAMWVHAWSILSGCEGEDVGTNSGRSDYGKSKARKTSLS